MWLAMNSVIFELLEEKRRMLIVNGGKRKAKERYKQIISELDEIGDMIKIRFVYRWRRRCLDGCL